MQYTDGKGLLDDGVAAGNGGKLNGGSSGSSNGSSNAGGTGGKKEQTSALHVLSVVAVLVAVLYGCLYVVIGKR